MTRCRRNLLALVALFVVVGLAPGAEQVITPKLYHLRSGKAPEWADFPREAEGASLKLRFKASPNSGPASLRLRQQDVRETWRLTLNGKDLGRLHADENDMVVYYPVPAGALVEGENTLVVETSAIAGDDIRVGEIALDDRPIKEALADATVEVSVLDATRQGSSVPTPCRITIVNAAGALATVGATSGHGLAVRPGVVYTADGRAKFGLPAGEYTVYAGRGFEYGIDSVKLSVKPGDTARKTLSIRREVPTPGYVACDTHVHTLTHSGHGDATEDERVVTLAGEGIELPIATDHNKQIDFAKTASKHGVRRYFTPVVGNEVTTSIGHLNVFPLPTGGPVLDHTAKDWKSLFAAVFKPTDQRVVVLNHPRDRHMNFRPFGPERHVGLTGEELDGWVLRANAVEVVNSGAQQSDVMVPVRDWLALLNRGLYPTPVGSSDSHDVSRYIVGQGRTYVRVPDDRPGEIDVKAAVESFLAGRVNVSCGLLAEITVNGKYGPGDLAPAAESLKVSVRVLGPGWVKADRVELYVNGIKTKEALFPAAQKAGVKWEGSWTLPRPRYDMHLVAVATGPGVNDLYWPIARPYQSTSRVVNKRVTGVSGAVWFDGDGDEKRSCAHDYARRACDGHAAQLPAVFRELAGYDEAVATQAASILRARRTPPTDPTVLRAAREAGPHVERGFHAFNEAWRESEVARGSGK